MRAIMYAAAQLDLPQRINFDQVISRRSLYAYQQSSLVDIVCYLPKHIILLIIINIKYTHEGRLCSTFSFRYMSYEKYVFFIHSER